MICTWLPKNITSDNKSFHKCFVFILYSVKQSDLFHKPTTYEQHVQTSSKQKITFPRHEYGHVGVFRIKIKPFFQKL